MMDYDKLIERLKSAAGGPEGIKMCQGAALAIETLRAELARVTAERDAAVERIREWEKFDTYLFVHNFITPEKWRGQKEG